MGKMDSLNDSSKHELFLHVYDVAGLTLGKVVFKLSFLMKFEGHLLPVFYFPFFEKYNISRVLSCTVSLKRAKLKNDVVFVLKQN